jgi:hypothetical protein
MSHKSNIVTTLIKPSPEQNVHEIEIPAELYPHILESTIGREIFNYRIEGIGQEAKLVKV